MKTLTVKRYQCNVCKNVHDNKEDAIGCEKRCQNSKDFRAFEKKFPRPKEDDRFTHYCCKCYTIVRKYDVEENMDRFYLGKCTICDVTAKKILYNWYCFACYMEEWPRILRWFKKHPDFLEFIKSEGLI